MTPETAIKTQIKDYLKLMGWFVRHNLAGLGCYPGMPDLIATKNGITIEIEVKTQKGRQSDHQKRYMRDLVAQGGFYVLTRGVDDLKQSIKSIERSVLYES